MAGAPSHLELFDNKPQLAKFDGTLPPPELLKGYRAAFINPPTAKLLGPKFKFAKHGQCGVELSELLPHLADGRRRHRHRPLAGDRCVQPRAGPDHDEHRLAAVRPAELRLVGDLRPRQRIARVCRLRRLQLRQERPQRRQFELGQRLSAHASIKACRSAPAAIRCSISSQSARHRRRGASAIRSIRSRSSTRCGSTSSAIRRSPRASTPSRWRTACRPAPRN